MTSPTIDSAHVQPPAGSMPKTLLSTPWNWTRIQLTPIFSQSRMNMPAFSLP